MKIIDCFNNAEIITIDYVWVSWCKVCKKTIKTIDEEYSFCGTIADFKDKYENEKNYPGVLDLESEITEIKPNHYEYCENDLDNNICDDCKEEGGI